MFKSIILLPFFRKKDRQIDIKENEVVIIAGLGNPEKKYNGTRHNAGFAAIDALCDKYGIELSHTGFKAAYGTGRIGDHKVILMKPLTYMNLSGEAIGPICHYYKISPENDLIVISDDIDQEPGNIRIRPKGSAGGHNGLKSIIACCGTDAFTRIRVGVGRKPEGMDLADHVLGRFDPDDAAEVREAIENVAEAVKVILDEGTDAAMSRFNRKKKQES
nr:aminoacyl-tRNA hydrolase [Butyrivibrio sp. MC2013]